MFAVESLIDGSWHVVYDWNDAWWWAKHICCHGGNPAGNVRVHETTRFDPSSYRSEYSPGYKQTPDVRRKIISLLQFSKDC